ncbi:hypothetical protein GCM10027290_50470 [Micromonospora sonneratiae]
MTLAVLLPADPASAPFTLASGEPLADRIADQLRRAGAREVRVTADLAELAELADTVGEPLLLCGDDLVAHAAVLRHLATSPVGQTGALILTSPPAGADQPAGAGQPAVIEDRGQVVAAGSAATANGIPTGSFGGALRVGVEDLPALAGAARVAAGTTDGTTALDRLFAAFSRTDTRIFAHRVRLLVAHRVADQPSAFAAEAAVAEVHEDRAELRLSVKEKDDFFTTYAVSTWSPYVTRLAARIGLGPTGVTAISVLFAVAAAALFGYGGRPALVAGAILLYLGFVLDCVDGQLARYTRQFSAWGGWLDTMADRAKEYVVYAGLAVGVERSGLADGWGWPLAIAAITLQTVRHMTDTWYGALHDEAARRPKPAAAAGGLGARLSQASTRVQADTGSLSYWLKRTVVFPIGERWALIALAVALFNPLVALVAVLAWGALAFAYTGALRTLRARSMRVSVLDTVDTTLYRDDGPLASWLALAGRRLPGLPGPLILAVLAAIASAALLGAGVAGFRVADLRWWLIGVVLVVLLAGLPAARPHTGALDWLVPAALRAAEYLFVIAVGVIADVPSPVTFALLFVLALHHYDLTARLEKRERPPLLHSFGLGWDGRLAFLTAAVVVGAGSLAAIGTGELAAYLFLVFAVNAVGGWTSVSVGSRRRSDDSVKVPDNRIGPPDVADRREAAATPGAAEERNT